MSDDTLSSFPLVFNKCPACGSQETVARQLLEEEKANGRITKEINAAIAMTQTPMVDPGTVRLAVTKATLLVSFYDICLACGCYYAVRVEKTEAYLSAQPQPRPGPRSDMRDLGFGKG